MLGGLVVLAVILFYSLQKYVVTTPDGISLELPILMDGSGEAGDDPLADLPKAEIVIDEPNYENVKTDAGEGLEPLRALFVGASDISETGLASAAETAQSIGADALVLELKPTSGLLSWSSASATAASYGTAGVFDLGAAAASLKQQGFYLAAQLSVCADGLIAARNPNAALKTAEGEAARLDPYNSFVRGYILELLTELDAMGFDEVTLSNLSMPTGEFEYSQTMAYDANAETALLSFANWLIRNSGGLELNISAVLDGSGAGQNEKNFFMMFDRVCYLCGDGETEAKRASAQSAMASGSTGLRFVPILSAASEDGSWIVKY